MSEWKEFELDECCEILSSKRIFASDYVSNGIPFYRSKEIIEKAHGQFSGDELYITHDRFNEIKEKFGAPIKGDLLISAVGNRSGIPYCVKEDYDFYFKDGNLIWFRNFGEELDSKFLEYILSSNIGQKKIEAMMIGSAQKALTIAGIKKIRLNLPPLPEQKAIAQILGTLDDKIELNRKMNQTLEAMAQTLFKSWFVDFDPVLDNALAAGNEIPHALKAKAEKRKALLDRHSALDAESSAAENGAPLLHSNRELTKLFPSSFTYNETLDKWVPEGWEVKKLEEIVSVKYGKDHKNLNEGIIPCYGSGGVMRLVEKSLYDKESVLIPRKGTLNNIIYINTPFWSVDTMFYTVMEHVDIAKYFYYTMKRLNFAEMNEGSAVPSMTTAQLNSLDIILPSDKCLSWFDKTIAGYFAKMEGNEQENKTLTKLRDTLLPQLVSGKVRVPEEMIDKLENKHEVVK